MNKQSIFRRILNLILLVIAVLSLTATGFLALKEYHFQRIPEVITESESVEDSQQDSSSNRSVEEFQQATSGK